MKFRTILIAGVVIAAVVLHVIVAFNVVPVRWRWPALGLAGVLLVVNAVWWIHKRHRASWSRLWSLHDDGPEG